MTEPAIATIGPKDGEATVPNAWHSGWQPLTRTGAAALAIAIVLSAILVLPRVVWAPCLDDPGEVQITAAVGGIGHPPGHAGLITVYRALCLMLPFPPHLTVSGATALFALGAVGMLMLLQLRSGVHPLAAGMSVFYFLVDSRFWHAALTPELYAICYCGLIGATWLFLSWLHDPKAWKLWAAAFVFSYIAANRAPVGAFAIAFVATAFLNPAARRFWTIKTKRRIALLVVICIAPVLVMLASVWMRDVPGNPYNYLDRSYPAFHSYPEHNVTASDKLERLWWLVSAKQFDYMFHPNWRTVKAQARWIASALGTRYWPAMLAGAVIIAIGAWTLWKTNRSVGLFVILSIPAAVVPILLIRVVSNTAMFPDLLFPLTWLFAIGLTRLMQLRPAAIWQVVLPALVAFTFWFTADASLLQNQKRFDSSGFVREVDLERLPPNAVLITGFDAVALVYTQQALGIRPDVTILNQHGRLNRKFLESLHRPVFTTEPVPPEIGAQLIGDGLVREIRLPSTTSHPPGGAGAKTPPPPAQVG